MIYFNVVQFGCKHHIIVCTLYSVQYSTVYIIGGTEENIVYVQC